MKGMGVDYVQDTPFQSPSLNYLRIISFFYLLL